MPVPVSAMLISTRSMDVFQRVVIVNRPPPGMAASGVIDQIQDDLLDLDGVNLHPGQVAFQFLDQLYLFDQQVVLDHFRSRFPRWR